MVSRPPLIAALSLPSAPPCGQLSFALYPQCLPFKALLYTTSKAKSKHLKGRFVLSLHSASPCGQLSFAFCAHCLYPLLYTILKKNKLAKLRWHASRIYFAKIHFGWLHFGKIHLGDGVLHLWGVCIGGQPWWYVSYCIVSWWPTTCGLCCIVLHCVVLHHIALDGIALHRGGHHWWAAAMIGLIVITNDPPPALTHCLCHMSFKLNFNLITFRYKFKYDYIWSNQIQLIFNLRLNWVRFT